MSFGFSSPAPSPEVSVLMSCYNASRWLHQAIGSVLAQTFRDFEFIVVDDGSTDETWDIIRAYSDQDQRIVAVGKRNSGLADSLNVGIIQARGGWIARLDADDLCEPTRLEEQVDFVHKHPDVVLLGTGFLEIDEQGRGIKKHSYPSAHGVLVRHLKRLQPFFPHSSAFFRRDIAQAAGCYNHLFKKTQDWDLWLRFAERGTIASLRDCLVRVRKHPQQIQNSTAGRAQIVYGAAASICYFLRAQGYPDPSQTTDVSTWERFLAWVDERMTKESVLRRRKLWMAARAEYFDGKPALTDALRLGTQLLRSGYASALVCEKLFGWSLPKRLAREWMMQPCAAS